MLVLTDISDQILEGYEQGGGATLELRSVLSQQSGDALASTAPASGSAANMESISQCRSPQGKQLLMTHACDVHILLQV